MDIEQLRINALQAAMETTKTIADASARTAATITAANAYYGFLSVQEGN